MFSAGGFYDLRVYFRPALGKRIYDSLASRKLSLQLGTDAYYIIIKKAYGICMYLLNSEF